jgi:hypothetical protein
VVYSIRGEPRRDLAEEDERSELVRAVVGVLVCVLPGAFREMVVAGFVAVRVFVARSRRFLRREEQRRVEVFEGDGYV